jgi:hypothetical protein
MISDAVLLAPTTTSIKKLTTLNNMIKLYKWRGANNIQMFRDTIVSKLGVDLKCDVDKAKACVEVLGHYIIQHGDDFYIYGDVNRSIFRERPDVAVLTYEG